MTQKRGQGRAQQAAVDLGVIVGALRECARGLNFLSDPPIEKMVATTNKLAGALENFGEQCADYGGTNWHVEQHYELGRAADLLEAYASDSGKPDQHMYNSSQKKRSDPSVRQMKYKIVGKLMSGLRHTLVQTQSVLMQETFRHFWDQVRPMVAEISTTLSPILKTLPHSESKSRRSLSLESKLRGRLATLGLVKTSNRTLASATLKGYYGDRLGTLVENGNAFALRLAGLIDQRRSASASGLVDPVLLENLERPIAKLSRALGLTVNEENLELIGLMRLANSPHSFSSFSQFKNNLTEGLILNVTRLASNALSIPAGHYLVWTTDAKSTMLVPTNEAKNDTDLMAERPQQFDIVTPELLGCWNKVERVLGEASSDHKDSRGSYENPAGGPERIGRPALKRKVEAAGGVIATADMTGLSKGDVSKHVNNREFEISGDSARAYMRGIGADPDDLYKYGQVKIFDYGDKDEESARSDTDRDEGKKGFGEKGKSRDKKGRKPAFAGR